jgi:hypothetical protein
LRQAIEHRNSSATNRRAASSQAKQKQAKVADLKALTHAFGQMFGTNMSVQARGKLFESFLRELFNRQSIKWG